MTNPFESSTFGNSLSLRVDGAIGAMSLSPNGRDAVLAGRKGLFIIDLDDPFLAPRWLHHITSWEVADVQWSPHNAIKPSWCISTSNQKALLWDLARPSNNAIQNVLHRHVRAITDINFHPQDPELLATCSIDTFVYCWDMRSPRRPVNKWAEWRAGATQVKWNRTNPNQIASSHHHSFYLWDSRMGALPLLRIENAHGGKINGLDFNSNENRLITCSNDKTIKVWDLGDLSEENAEPAVVINADFPIARARSLPFGDDGCCGIMPLRGGDNAIHFLNYSEAYKTSREANHVVEIDVKSEVLFKGHQGPVKDFLWRVQHEKYKNFESKKDWKEFQLVTWSPTDYDLKLWPQDRRVYEMANYSPQHKRGIDLLTKSNDVAISGEDSLATNEQCNRGLTLEYNSYITEPESSLGDMLKSTNEDLLSRLALFEIKKSQVQETSAGQLNHLNWIFGVRMGTKFITNDNINTVDNSRNDSPANLGEEISIVGHKFPKIRFEKISVSTGHIILSLRGPLPATPGMSQVSNQELSKAADLSNAGDTVPSKKQSSAPNSSEKQSLRSTQESASSTIADKNIPTQFSNDLTFSKGTLIEEMNTSVNDLPITKTTEPTSENKLIFIRIEIKFPKQYPHLKQLDSKAKLKRHFKQKKSNSIKFKIEETHELNEAVRSLMLQNLVEISQFYTMKYNRYCLEPCLRYLLGDRIDLDDALMLGNDVQLDNELEEGIKNESDGGNSNSVTSPKIRPASFGPETYSKVDNGLSRNSIGFNDNNPLDIGHPEEENADIEDEDMYNDADLIPGVEDDGGYNELFEPINSHGVEQSSTDQRNIKHNITPLPKACSAVWANSGQLVCFFVAKGTMDEIVKEKGSRNYQMAQLRHTGPNENTKSGRAKSNDTPLGKCSEDKSEVSNMVLSSAHEDYSSDFEGSLHSSDDFSDDWDEVIRDDLQTFSNFPSAFKEKISLGHTQVNRTSRGSFTRGLSGKGTASISSYVEDSMLRSTKRTKGYSTCKHYIRTHDFGYLIPEKPELATSYQLLGTSPKESARINGQIAFSKGMADVGEAWKLVEMIIASSDQKPVLEEFLSNLRISHGSWGYHPFGHSWLINELFEYFQKQNNLQMLAMMSCVLHDNSVETYARDSDDSHCQIESNITPCWSHDKDVAHKMVEIRPDSAQVSENAAMETEGLGTRIPIANLRQSRHSKSIAYSNERAPSPNLHNSQKRGPEQSGLPFLHSMSASGHRSSGDRKMSESQRRLPKKQASNSRNHGGVLGKTSHNSTLKRDKISSAVCVSITVMNSEELDLRAGSQRTNLLSCVDKSVIAGYREKYAELLYSWNLPYERIKMLKFNYSLEKESLQANKSLNYTCYYGVRNRRLYDERQHLLNPISTVSSKSVNLWNTSKRGTISYCSLCNQIAANKILFCLECEHLLHFRCAADWWTDSDDDTNDVCPTGCGCHCAASRAVLSESKVF